MGRVSDRVVLSASRRLAVLLLFAAVGCSGGGGAESAGPVPAPQGKQAEHCRALHRALPGTVGGLKRRAVGPDSEFTAFWGSPAIALRCGVRRPLVVTEGHDGYRPWTPTWEFRGVEWMPEGQPGGDVRLTTSKREAWVEVTVPKKYTGGDGEFGALDVLSDAVRKTIPFGYIG
ncbi:DUF3515 domain-containing protein [Streptomyces sp. NPDC046215]|uniref:DUF3515 domain-containing protein n=1 Tax=Streptomyces stramineus TaxID=173861 RepID=A0ABN1B617_9ACTN